MNFSTEAPQAPYRAYSAMRQIPLDLGPVSVPGLADYIDGDNGQAKAWLERWPGPGFNQSPVYLWGPSGVGKTHLLRAQVQKALSLGCGVIWLNSQTCQMWDAPDPAMPTLAVIDDCQLLDPHHQHLAFNLFIESATAGVVLGDPAAGMPMLGILAAGNVPPVDLPVRDDLRTRLGWGLTFALRPLDESGVREALQREAARRGMALGDGVVSYLLTRYARDLSFLMHLLDQLDRFALAEHREITVPLLKQMLAQETA